MTKFIKKNQIFFLSIACVHHGQQDVMCKNECNCFVFYTELSAFWPLSIYIFEFLYIYSIYRLTVRLVGGDGGLWFPLVNLNFIGLCVFVMMIRTLLQLMLLYCFQRAGIRDWRDILMVMVLPNNCYKNQQHETSYKNISLYGDWRFHKP